MLIAAVPACAAPGAEETATAEPTTPAPAPTQETPVSPSGDDNLANTEWTLESFGPMGAETPVLEGTTVTLIFESGGQAGGSDGCNSYGTDYQVQDNSLIFGEIVSTLMACTEEGVTEQEQRYLTALRAAGEFEQTADQLTISYNNGQSVLNFVPATPSSDGSSSGESFPPEDPIRIAFDAGETSAQIGPTAIAEYDTDYYVLQALEGQEMTVEITSPNNDVVLTIVTEDGMPIKRYQNGPPASWTGTLPDSQDYYVYAISFGPDTSYTLTVQIDPL